MVDYDKNLRYGGNDENDGWMEMVVGLIWVRDESKKDADGGWLSRGGCPGGSGHGHS